MKMNFTAATATTAATSKDRKSHKVIFILGATGTGKSKLSLGLASRFPAEIINSDKIQVYHGLDISTNKVTEAEQKTVRHHLLGHVADPEADYAADHFVGDAKNAIKAILDVGKVPIVVGGSNSYIEALVEGAAGEGLAFKERYECMFLWMDVAATVLWRYVGQRVDEMVAVGLVEEVRRMYAPAADYSRGIRRSIGAPELHRYFKEEHDLDEGQKTRLLKEAIEEIKQNTCHLTVKQVAKIQRFKDDLGWSIHRIDATSVFEKVCTDDVAEEWENVVMKPCMKIVEEFLNNDGLDVGNGVAADDFENQGFAARAIRGIVELFKWLVGYEK